jgi:hypothetical protein
MRSVECLGRQEGDTFWKLSDGAIVAESKDSEAIIVNMFSEYEQVCKDLADMTAERDEFTKFYESPTEILTHTRSCCALDPSQECTCGLYHRNRVQTAEAVRSAWMKRAMEAETDLAAMTAERESLKCYLCDPVPKDCPSPCKCLTVKLAIQTGEQIRQQTVENIVDIISSLPEITYKHDTFRPTFRSDIIAAIRKQYGTGGGDTCICGVSPCDCASITTGGGE